MESREYACGAYVVFFGRVDEGCGLEIGPDGEGGEGFETYDSDAGVAEVADLRYFFEGEEDLGPAEFEGFLDFDFLDAACCVVSYLRGGTNGDLGFGT